MDELFLWTPISCTKEDFSMYLTYRGTKSFGFLYKPPYFLRFIYYLKVGVIILSRYFITILSTVHLSQYQTILSNNYPNKNIFRRTIPFLSRNIK